MSIIFGLLAAIFTMKVLGVIAVIGFFLFLLALAIKPETTPALLITMAIMMVPGFPAVIMWVNGKPKAPEVDMSVAARAFQFEEEIPLTTTNEPPTTVVVTNELDRVFAEAVESTVVPSLTPSTTSATEDEVFNAPESSVLTSNLMAGVVAEIQEEQRQRFWPDAWKNFAKAAKKNSSFAVPVASPSAPVEKKIAKSKSPWGEKVTPSEGQPIQPRAGDFMFQPNMNRGEIGVNTGYGNSPSFGGYPFQRTTPPPPMVVNQGRYSSLPPAPIKPASGRRWHFEGGSSFEFWEVRNHRIPTNSKGVEYGPHTFSQVLDVNVDLSHRGRHQGTTQYNPADYFKSP